MPVQPTRANPGPHPLVHAGKSLLADLFSTLLFVLLYAATGSIYVATGVSIAIGFGFIGYLKLRGRPIDAMLWLSLGLVVVFGGVTLLTHNAIFVMVKPTFIYTAIGVVMLRPGWMNRYMVGRVQTWGADVTRTFGYVWAGLMFGTAAANLAFAFYSRPVTWAWFVGVFPIASKFVLVAIQYIVTRGIVRRRIRRAREEAFAAG